MGERNNQPVRPHYVPTCSGFFLTRCNLVPNRLLVAPNLIKGLQHPIVGRLGMRSRSMAHHDNGPLK